MAMREAVRPGGRSERVQRAVHAAVRTLASRMPETELTIPLIAIEARVTPSTVYRRWGSLTDLMADVALERMRPDGEPPDTGSLRGDLAVWLDHYAEEMASGVGRTMIRDVLAASDKGEAAARCSGYVRDQLSHMVERAVRRGEPAASPQRLLDIVVAPVMYRVLFGGGTVSAEDQRCLIDLATRPVVEPPAAAR